MTSVFADTSFYIALLVDSDAYHRKAVELLAAYRGRVVTTAWVLTEVGNYLSPCATRRLFQQLIYHLRNAPDVTLIQPSSQDFERGLSLYFDRLDKNWSLVDCLSFSAMQRQNISQAWTADHHFEQAGFKALLLE